MAYGSSNLRLSRKDRTPTTTNGVTKGWMAQALWNGLVLSFELSILVLLLFLRFVKLGKSLNVVPRTWSDKRLPFGVQFLPAASLSSLNLPISPKVSRTHQVITVYLVFVAKYWKNPQARSEDHGLNEPQRPQMKAPVSRTSLMRSSSTILPGMSTTQHKEPAPTREAAEEHEFPDVDSADELDLRRVVDEDRLLPVTPSKRSVLCRLRNMSQSTDSPTSAIIPTQSVNPGQMAHKRHQTMSHHDSKANLRESASTRQDRIASNAFSTISFSRTAIELQPSVVEPSLLQNPLSPPRPVAHIELPHRRVSETYTHGTLPVLRSVEDGPLKGTDSLSYLRTLAKAKKGTTGSTSAVSKRHQSHRNAPST